MAWPTDATGHQNTTTSAVFIPELWSDEVLGAYKANLVVANLVTRIAHNGKKGDTIHIPVPGRNAATAKAFNSTSAVTLNNDTATQVNVLLDQHFEWSMLFDDIATLQALDSMRRFYTDDGGYALARQVDWHLHLTARLLQGGTGTTLAPNNSTSILATPGATAGSETYTAAVIGGDGETAWDPTANTNAGNQSAIADVGIRTMIQTLDDVDVPLMDRNLIIPPVEKKNLLGLSRYTEQAFTGEAGAANSIRTGLIGDVYGIPVYVSTQCVTVQADDDTTNCRAGILMHKNALAYAEQMAVRTQTQYKQEFLSDLFTADVVYGVAELRDTSGIVFIVPA